MTLGEHPAQLRALPPDAGGEILPSWSRGNVRGNVLRGAAMRTVLKLSDYFIEIAKVLEEVPMKIFLDQLPLKIDVNQVPSKIF